MENHDVRKDEEEYFFSMMEKQSYLNKIMK